MGWLSRLTGRSKVDVPDEFLPLLESAQNYAMRALLLAVTKDMLGGGAPVTTDTINRPDPKAALMLAVELGDQLSKYTSAPSLQYSAAVALMMTPFGMKDIARLMDGARILAAHEATIPQMMATCAATTPEVPRLSADTTSFIFGIVVGNRMAQEFLTQIRAGVAEPSVGDDLSALFHRHILLNGRKIGEDSFPDLEPGPFVPNVREWLDGTAPQPMTVQTRGAA